MNRPMTPPEKIMGEARWMPTAEAINALPDGLRHYIHDLESRADPAGDCARATLAEDARDRLASLLTSQRAEIAQLRVERDNAREMEDTHGDNWEAAQAEVERLRGEVEVLGAMVANVRALAARWDADSAEIGSVHQDEAMQLRECADDLRDAVDLFVDEIAHA